MSDNPVSTRQWMTQYLWNVGKLDLSQLCMPRSHDAGISTLSQGAGVANNSNVQTQTKTIFEQLCLGVRRLDIRPYLLYDNLKQVSADWRCGHWSYDNRLKNVGSNAISIRQVVEDVNKFTADNPELVVLEISHTSALRWDTANVLVHGAHPIRPGTDEDDNPSHYSQPSDDEWTALFMALANLNHLCRVTDNYDEAYQDNFMASRKLEDLITYKDGNDVKNKAAVIVMVDGYPNTFVDGEGSNTDTYNRKRRQLFNLGFLPLSALRNDDLGLCTTADNSESFFQTIGVTSIISDAKDFQHKEIPSAPQALTNPDKDDYKAKASRYGHNAISMDAIEDPTLVTLALASSFYNHNAFYQPDQKLVVCYGGKMITDSQVLANIQGAIDQKKAFNVNNTSMGGETWFGQKKLCVVMWMGDDSRGRGWCAFEGEDLPLGYRIGLVQYGTLDNVFTDVFTPSMYVKLIRSIYGKSPFTVSNDFVGWDPYPGHVKQLGVIYDWQGKYSTIQKREGETLEFDPDGIFNCVVM